MAFAFGGSQNAPAGFLTRLRGHRLPIAPDRTSDGRRACQAISPLVSTVSLAGRTASPAFRHGAGIGAALGPASIIEPDRTQQIRTCRQQRGDWTGPDATGGNPLSGSELQLQDLRNCWTKKYDVRLTMLLTLRV